MKHWIAFILAAACLLCLTCCAKPPVDTSSTATKPSAPPPATTTTSQITQETLPPQTKPPAIWPTDYDTQWGKFAGKVFVYEYVPSGKHFLPKEYLLHLYTDGTFRNSYDPNVSAYDEGTWSFENNILTLYYSVYYEEFDYTYYYSSRFHYENGVLTLLESENNIPSLLVHKSGTEYVFRGAVD